MVSLLLCTDLDRTLIPNGNEPESPQALPLLTQLIKELDICLVYVTGRHRELVEKAIFQYRLPIPTFVIADVGASLYHIQGEEWTLHEGWENEIGQDWRGKTAKEVQACFWDLQDLTLQEREKQGRYKLSYYFPLDSNAEAIVTATTHLLDKYQVKANIIYSVDEIKEIGLLDILPSKASKLQAIEYLMSQENYSLENTVFAGDSGNDLSVLSSQVKSILVGNARSAIKDKALDLSKSLGNQDSLYIATGKSFGMNGNYSAGILEGLSYYFPEIHALIDLKNEE